MTFKHSLKTAFRGLEANRSRSLLTMLGIIIGVTSIMLVMSLGEGAQNLILGQVQGIGSKTIAILPGRTPSGPSDVAQLFGDSLKEKDLTLLRRKEVVPSINSVFPIMFGAQSASYGNQTYRPTIFASTEAISNTFDLGLTHGTFFSAEDVRAHSAVVVIGATVQTELFGNDDALGKRIKINGRSFLVLGVLPVKGQVSFFDFDKAVILPYTAGEDYVFGRKYFDRIIAEAVTEDAIPGAVSEIKAALRDSHNITDPSKDDFSVEAQADLAARLSTITSVLTLFLAAVAAISLLVGGIGIMNIMLVSVTERTKEIGLRKALGATYKDILTQFLTEAILLTGAGGVVGVLLGTVLSYGISLILSKVAGLAWVFSFPVGATLLGIGVSGGIGLIFGLYPARKAAQKSPIEALRYE